MRRVVGPCVVAGGEPVTSHPGRDRISSEDSGVDHDAGLLFSKSREEGIRRHRILVLIRALDWKS